MNVHILRSPEYSTEDYNEVVNLLKTHTNSIKIKSHPKVNISYENEEPIKHWDEFFKICDQFRSNKKIHDNDYVFLLTEHQNQEDYFGWTDEKLGNYFIQTSGWNRYFESQVNKHFPISYEVVAWILRSLMYDTQEELLKNAHIRARGCVMDYCDEKEDIILKMRTGDVCYECLKRISDRGVNISFVGNIFDSMETIRKGLMYRERNEILDITSPLFINLNVDKPKFALTDLNNLPVKLGVDETIFYLFLFQSGGLNYHDFVNNDELFALCYSKVKRSDFDPREYRIDFKTWTAHDNKKSFEQKVSKINRTLRDLLGVTFSKPYLVYNEDGVYHIKMPRAKVDIQGWT